MTTKNMYALVQERHGPGAKIMLRESEAYRLKQLGFVVAPEDYKPMPPLATTKCAGSGCTRQSS